MTGMIQGIFLGLKCLSPGFFFFFLGGGGERGKGVGKFGKYFVRWFDSSRDFLGVSKRSLVLSAYPCWVVL